MALVKSNCRSCCPAWGGGIVNFWLDGHYSHGISFRAEKDTPIKEELAAIEEALPNLDSIAVLIDDVRCFYPDEFTSLNDYPQVDYLVDWARKNGFRWRIVHDIFIMQQMPHC